MNYRLIYRDLMDRAVGREMTAPLSGYSELHHRIPRCLGGKDADVNLVRLTAREHYVAHQLLVKMHPGSRRLAHAAHMLATVGGGKAYEWIKRAHSTAISSAKTGNKYWLGRKHTEKTKKTLRRVLAGKQNCLGRVLSDETKAKIGAAHRGMKMGAEFSENGRQRAFDREMQRAYKDGSARVPGITERADGWFVVRRVVDGQRQYAGAFRALADAKECHGRA